MIMHSDVECLQELLRKSYQIALEEHGFVADVVSETIPRMTTLGIDMLACRMF